LFNIARRIGRFPTCCRLFHRPHNPTYLRVQGPALGSAHPAQQPCRVQTSVAPGCSQFPMFPSAMWICFHVEANHGILSEIPSCIHAGQAGHPHRAPKIHTKCSPSCRNYRSITRRHMFVAALHLLDPGRRSRIDWTKYPRYTRLPKSRSRQAIALSCKLRSRI
jgi:hypothetical protein